MDIPDLGRKCHGDYQVYAAQRLKRADNRRQRPVRDELLDYLFQAFNPLLRDSHRFNHFLERYLVGRVLELLLLEPAQIPHRPALLARIDAPVLEHECANLLAMNAQRLHRRRSGPNEIPHGLVAFIGNPYGRQFAGAKQSCQRDRVAPVRLHPVARPSRDERRRHHSALMAKLTDQTV